LARQVPRPCSNVTIDLMAHYSGTFSGSMLFCWTVGTSVFSINSWFGDLFRRVTFDACKRPPKPRPRSRGQPREINHRGCTEVPRRRAQQQS